MKIKYRKKLLEVRARKVSFLGKYLGLIFKSSKTDNLFFDFGFEKIVGIHSFFVFFPFLAVWLDKKNEVVDFSVVKPFTLLVRPKKTAKKLLELPLNRRNEYLLKFFRRERKSLYIR